MADLTLPSQELLRQLLRYEAETGKLFWKERPLSSFRMESRGKVWNSRFADKSASFLGARGYLVLSLMGKRCYAHRVIWAMHADEWPAEVDHINGDRLDNRIENLRSASRETNGRNLSVKSTNTSGVNGVYWNKKDQRWQAYGKISGKMEYIGQFLELSDAAAARREWELLKGFHPNHGQR